jgi:acetyl esterase/lipase
MNSYEKNGTARCLGSIGMLAAVLVSALLLAPVATGQDAERTGVLYLDESETDAYAREQCRLDVYLPEGVDRFSTVVWFHAGGLRSGQREIPEGLKGKGIAVVGVGYRLHPRVSAPVYIEDAAAAVAWVMEHIEELGGSRDRVFLSGHSAGGYLASMVGLDKRWLAPHGVDADELAGLAPVSGHTVTHFTVRQERGIAGHTAIVDDLAPQFHVRKDAPPMLLVTGDRELELLGRYEENAYFWRMMHVAGHSDTTIEELGGFDHGGVVEPALPLVIRFVRRIASGD